MSSIIRRRSGLTLLVSLIGRSFLSEVERPSILRTGLPVAPSLSNRLATRLPAHAPREAGRSAATSCLGATVAFRLRPQSGAFLPYQDRTGNHAQGRIRRPSGRTQSVSISPLDRRPPKIIGVSAIDLHRHDLAGPQRTAGGDIHRSVDLRRVALAAAFPFMRAALVDNDSKPPADFRGELLCADRLAPQHEALVARSLDLGRHGLEAGIVGLGALDRLVSERADAVEFCFVQPVEEELEVLQ